MLALVNTPNGKAPVELRQVPEPAPGLHEALVAVQAFSLNRGELRSFRNNEEGWIPGQDISGIVLRQAADGSGPPAGARIVALMDEFGWAERAAVPTQRIAVLPDTVSFAAAAALPVAGLTALRTLRHGALLLGKRVLITGAAGGVGHLAVQLAARSGAHVTAVAGRPERAAGLRELGASDVVIGIGQAQGRFGLILESAGGASLATALHQWTLMGWWWCSAIPQARRQASALLFSAADKMRACRVSSRSVRGRRSSLRRILQCWCRWSRTSR
jgi:NADPH2:quinone reductase